ncbi:MAG: maltose acetyltransferase domain-containing protein [Holdemania massiliensis]
MKEKTKMIAGEHYNPLDPQLIVLRDRATEFVIGITKSFP